MAYYATYMPNELGELQKVVINAGVGFVLPYYGETAPPGTLACDGSEISRTLYDELFLVLGTKAGAGDGSTTFNLPDLRGDFIRGLGGGNAGELGVEQGDAIRDFSGHFDVRLANNSTSIILGDNNLYKESIVSAAVGGNTYTEGIINTSCNRITFDMSSVVSTSAENRPVNVALLWCIIYE